MKEMDDWMCGIWKIERKLSLLIDIMTATMRAFTMRRKSWFGIKENLGFPLNANTHIDSNNHGVDDN